MFCFAIGLFLWIMVNVACFVILISRTDTQVILPQGEESEEIELNYTTPLLQWNGAMLDEREFIN